MAKLVTLLEQHLDRRPPTVVTQATTWWETVLACVKLQECGLGVHLLAVRALSGVFICVCVCVCVCVHGWRQWYGCTSFEGEKMASLGF